MLIRLIVKSGAEGCLMLLQRAFCCRDIFSKSDAKVANLVIRTYLLGKKCKVNQLIIPFKLYAMQGVRKHAALCSHCAVSCLQPQCKATTFPDFTFYGQRASMRFDKVFGDGKTQSATLYLGARHPEIMVEDALVITGINAFAKITHKHLSSCLRLCVHR